MKQSNSRSAGSRQRKQALWSQVARLAEEGLSSREIAQRLALSKATVDRWLRRIRQESAARQTLDPAEVLRQKIARYQAISDKLFEAWRLSQAEKQVRLIEKTGPAGDPQAAKEKRSVRSETQTGNAAYLAKAMDAENRIEALQQRLAVLEGTSVGGPGGRPGSLANLTDDDLEKLTPDDLENFTDDQLFVIATRLRAKYGPTDLPLLTNEDLRNMNDEQLTALELRLVEEIARSQNNPE